MVVIRLSRKGTNKRPFYHIVIADKRRAAKGAFVERIGYFNPIARGKAERLVLSLEKVDAWIAKGAQPSPRVRTLIKAHRTGEKVAVPKEAVA